MSQAGGKHNFTPHKTSCCHSLSGAGNTKGLTVPLTSCLTRLDQSVLQIKTKIVICHTADSKPVKQEVNGTVILPPLVHSKHGHMKFSRSLMNMGPGKLTYMFSAERMRISASRQASVGKASRWASGKQKSAYTRRKMYTLIYPYPMNITSRQNYFKEFS